MRYEGEGEGRGRCGNWWIAAKGGERGQTRPRPISHMTESVKKACVA